METLHDLDRAGLGAVLRTALDAVVVMRMDGTVVGWNQVAERIFGWSFADAFGRRMGELIVPARHRAAHEHGLAHYLATGEGPVLDRHIQIEALHRDGRELPVELSITRTEQFGEPVFLGFLRDRTDQREAARRQEELIGELNHRVKNVLAVVAGIAHQTARSAADLPGFARAFEGRLAAMARAHETLTDEQWRAAPLRRLVHQLVAAYTAQAQIAYSGPDIRLEPRQLLSIGMVLHELLQNAVVHGALSHGNGRLTLHWTHEGDELVMIWEESGMRGVSVPGRRGFGWRMVAISVAHDLGGTVEQAWHDHGLHCVIRVPLARPHTG